MATSDLSGTVERHFEEVIVPHRLQRKEQAIAALRALDSQFDPAGAGLPDRVTMALLSHTVYACIQAQGANDRALAEVALEIWQAPFSASSYATTSGKEFQWLMLDRERCINRPDIDRAFDTPCYLACGKSAAQRFDRIRQEFWEECWKILDLTELMYFPERATGMIIHLQYRDMSDSLTGYSLFPLAGTVFTDWTDSPLRHAESIVHEAGHSYLNMLLDATASATDGEAKYWSPWRGVERPAIGIVHGAWAFSIVHALYSRLAAKKGLGMLNPNQLSYCHDRSAYELSRLDEVRPYLRGALAAVGNTLVTDLVLEWFPSA